MRTIGTDLLNALRDGYFCFLVKITTKAGDVYAYTDHDKTIIRGAVTYQPAPGLTPLRTYLSSDLKIDSQEFGQAWVDAPEEDIIAGRFDDAEFVISRTDWRDDDSGAEVKIDLADVFHSIEWTRDGFRVGVQNGFTKLRRVIGRQTVPNCPYEFGSVQDVNNPRGCGFNIATVTYNVSVTSVTSKQNFVVGNIATTDGRLSNGKITFTSGPNAGLSYPIRKHTALSGPDREQIELYIPTFLLPVVGNNVTIVAGCKKTVADCISYNNIENFGGQPFIKAEQQFKL